MASQQVLDGLEGVGVKLRLSFGGMQAIADHEPELREPIHLAITGHVSKVGEAPADGDFLVVTVVGTPHLISEETYRAATNGLQSTVAAEE